ncbi:MAG: signal peptidase II [Halorhodospira sp.]
MGYRRWLLVAAGGAGIDQATKAWAQGALDTYASLELLPVLSLTLGYNTGAAFSLLGGAEGWQRWLLAAIAAGVSAYLVHWLRQIGDQRPGLALGLALILAGAAGNLIDRLRLGHVVDFIHLHYAGFHWPIFNVADIGITLGAGLVIGSYLLSSPPRDGA